MERKTLESKEISDKNKNNKMRFGFYTRVQQLDLPQSILKDIERLYAIRIEKLYTFFLPIEHVNQIDQAELDKWYFAYKKEINE